MSHSYLILVPDCPVRRVYYYDDGMLSGVYLFACWEWHIYSLMPPLFITTKIWSELNDVQTSVLDVQEICIAVMSNGSSKYYTYCLSGVTQPAQKDRRFRC
jgi:hypothetical protein